MTDDHRQNDPTCRCGWDEGLLASIRDSSGKRTGYLVAEAVQQIPHLIRNVEVARQADMASLIEQVNGALTGLQQRGDETTASLVEQVNTALDRLTRRVADLEAKASAPPPPITLQLPDRLGIDAEDLAQRVAAKMPKGPHSVKNIERNHQGDIVRIVESDL